MTKNLPAYRYDLFVKAFERKVSAAQAQIERLRRMEAPYNVVKEVMEAARLPNEQQLLMEPNYISAHVTATPADSLEGFEGLAHRIGQRLLEAKMHKDGVPATSHGGTLCCLWFCWHCENFDVRLYVGVPSGGMRDVEVSLIERRTIEHEYKLKRIEPKSYPTPESFKSGFPTPSELARIEAELGAAEREEVPF